MSEVASVKNAVEVEKLTVSEGARIVLRKNFDMPVSEVVEAVKDMVGKAPSKVLVYQIKNKMKDENGNKAKPVSKKKLAKKAVNKNHKHTSDSEKWISKGVSGTEFTKFAAKLAKIRQVIEEFGSKEELIGWANLA